MSHFYPLHKLEQAALLTVLGAENYREINCVAAHVVHGLTSSSSPVYLGGVYYGTPADLAEKIDIFTKNMQELAQDPTAYPRIVAQICLNFGGVAVSPAEIPLAPSGLTTQRPIRSKLDV